MKMFFIWKFNVKFVLNWRWNKNRSRKNCTLSVVLYMSVPQYVDVKNGPQHQEKIKELNLRFFHVNLETPCMNRWYYFVQQGKIITIIIWKKSTYSVYLFIFHLECGVPCEALMRIRINSNKMTKYLINNNYMNKLNELNLVNRNSIAKCNQLYDEITREYNERVSF